MTQFLRFTQLFRFSALYSCSIPPAYIVVLFLRITVFFRPVFPYPAMHGYSLPPVSSLRSRRGRRLREDYARL